MNSELSRDEVLHLISVWQRWMNGPDPANNKPDEFKMAEQNDPEGLSAVLGIVLHLFLWAINKFALAVHYVPLAIWAAQNRVKYDKLWFAPKSCGLNHAYTDLGIAYSYSGNMEKAIECLRNSWKVYPCPHNTTFGLSTRLCRLLSKCSIAEDAVNEYLDMRQRFRAHPVFAYFCGINHPTNSYLVSCRA